LESAIFLKPSVIWESEFPEQTFGATISKSVQINLDDVEGAIVLVGVCESRGSKYPAISSAPDVIRESFYKLYPEHFTQNIIDIGNIEPGNTIDDTYYALECLTRDVCKQAKLFIVLGGSNDLAYPFYKGLEATERLMALVDVDAKLDIGTLGDDIKNFAFKEKIITHKPNYLFNYSNIGYQSYLENQHLVNLFGDLSFDLHRLGEVRSNVKKMEPVIRNADVLLFDGTVLKTADFPANPLQLPNGIYAEEACQLMRYAGISDTLGYIGLFNLDTAKDRGATSAQLYAQMLWCLLEGYQARVGDYPFTGVSKYAKYIVSWDVTADPLIFYKSNKSDRWWIEAPKSMNKRLTNSYHKLIPCTFEDYEVAQRNQIPNAWWVHFYKN